MNAPRILVVDDHATNRKLVIDLLQFEGFDVVQAADADEAERVIRAAAPALVLMDIAPSGRDGLTLTRQLKADPSTRHIIVVALTAFAMKGDETRAFEAGCDAYVAKPIDTRKLPALITSLVRPPAVTGRIAHEHPHCR